MDVNSWNGETSNTLPVEEPVMPKNDIEKSSAMKVSKNGKTSGL